MTLYEVHSALARSLGDPFAETALSTIYDGVRYSKQARQGYLYRACCSIINEVVSQLAAVPREQGTEILVSLFPSMINYLQYSSIVSSTTTIYDFYDNAVNPQDYRCAYIINASLHDSSNTRNTPVPIVSPFKASKITSRAYRSQMNDCIAWIAFARPDALFIGLNQGANDYTGDVFEITFLRYPQNQVLTDGTVGFDFESSYMNAVLNKATLYGMTDGGDLTPEQILPLLAK